jgi:3-oxoadipate enol-lactonase
MRIQRLIMARAATVALGPLEQTGITRTRPFAVGVGAAIQAEAATRRLAAGIEGRRLPPINVHVGGDGPAVVMINGWTASGLVWPAQLIERLERRFTVLRPDNRGTGWSRRCLRPYSIADLAGDVRQVIERHGIERPIVVGISMGGMVAQELAVRWPDLPGHLVLLSTSPPSPDYTPPRPAVAASLLATAATADLATRVRTTWLPLAGPEFRAAGPAAVEGLVQVVTERPTPYFVLLDQARAIAAWYGVERLRRITAPTTVIHGAVDPLIPVRNGIQLSQLITGARYVELPGVGHLLPYEAPATLAEIIEDAEIRS